MKVVQYVDSNLFAPKDAWSKLTAQEKADVLRIGVENGYTKLSDIKEKYNKFVQGGEKEDSYYTQKPYTPIETNPSIESVVELRPEEVARLRAQENYKKWAKPVPHRLPDTYGYGNIAGLYDITDRVNKGGKELYNPDFPYSGTRVYKDKDGKIYKIDNSANINTEGLTNLSRQDLNNMLPQRDYIGGDDYRIKVAQRIPGFSRKVSERAKAYGISPNVLMHRLLKEGFIDYVTQQYNDADVATQKDPAFWNGFWNSKLGGYDMFGLDYVGDELMQDKYSLLDPNAGWYDGGEWEDTEGPDGHRTGKHRVTPVDLSSAIEMMAAGLGYRQGLMKNKYNPTPEDINAYTNGAYNVGPFSPILDNVDTVRARYSVPDYYGNGVFEYKEGGPIVQAANTFGSGGYTDDMIYEGGTLPEVTITQFPYLTEEEERRRRGEIREWDPSYMELVSDKFKDRNRDFVNLIGGLNKTVGTAASIAALATAGGWQTLRLLNKGKRARTALASAINATQNADKYADLAGFVFNPNMAGLIDLAANYLPSGDLLTKSGQLIYGIKNAANAYNIINGNKKSYGGPLVQQANEFRRGGRKTAKKVSDFSNGLLSPEDVDIILEHPSDFSEYLGWNQEKIDSLKNNFYNNTAPYGYDVLNGIAALQNTGINPQPIGTSTKEDMARDYLFAEYLGIPKENRKYPSTGIFTQSEYSPSMGSNTDTKYVRFSDEENRNKIVSIYNDLVSRIVTAPGTSRKVRSGKPYFSGVGNNLYRITPGKSGKNYVVSELSTYDFNEDPYAASLGQYTVGRGFDNKGQYVSVYDEWDLNPMNVLGSPAYPLPKKLVKKFSSLGDASGKFGKPVKYYDRIYLDDYYDIPEQYRGNYYLPEVTVKP